jgi:hypothetical protein
LSREDQNGSSRLLSKRAIILTLLLVGVPMLLLAYGCSRSTSSSENKSAAVETSLQSYLGDRGEVMSGGCTDAQSEKNGLRLFKCVVYPASGPQDPETWNVAVDSTDTVVNASPE